MGTIITVAGNSCVDLITYISRMLQGNGSKVLVSDTSANKEFIFYSGILELQPKDIGEIGNISVRNGRFTQEDYQNYDFILLYTGNVLLSSIVSASSKIIVSTTPEDSSLDKLSLNGIDTSDKLILICRSVFYKSYSSKYICTKLGISDKNSKILETGFEEKDYMAFLENQSKPNPNFSKISYNFKNVIIEVIRNLGIEKDISKLYSKVSKGGSK